MPDTFTCPRCSKPLRAMRGDHGDYFRCDFCPGHLVSVTVLLGATDRREIRHLWRTACQLHKRGIATGRPCLVCQKPMVVVPVKTKALDTDCEIDVCTTDRQIWLDETTLDRTLARMQSADLSPSAQTALREVGVGLSGKKGEQFSLMDVAEIILACLTNGLFSVR